MERSEASTSRKRTPAYLKWGSLAACLALVIGLGGMAVAAEAKEYDTAVAFFEDNGLSTEGLSRSDLKAVYRDITTQSFTYGKTEELAELWNRNLWQNAQLDDGVSYRIYYQYKLDKALGFDVLDNSVLDCYQAGTLLWTVEFPGLLVEDSVHTSAGTAVWCRNET